MRKSREKGPTVQKPPAEEAGTADEEGAFTWAPASGAEREEMEVGWGEGGLPWKGLVPRWSQKGPPGEKKKNKKKKQRKTKIKTNENIQLNKKPQTGNFVH